MGFFSYKTTHKIYCYRSFQEMTEKNKDVIDKMLADVAAKIEEKDLPPLLNRDFVTLDTGSVTGEVIRVMQWNMLAQGKIK